MQNLKIQRKTNSPEFTILQSQKILINFSKISLFIFPNLDKLEILLCENENNHLAGNVYVMFESAEDAYNANLQLNQEWFNGKPVYSDLSP